MDNEFDEYDLLEAEYADQLQILDELEGLTSQNKNTPNESAATYMQTADDCDLPDISQREPRRRKLFLPNESNQNREHLEDEVLENDALVIDENELENFFTDDISLSPQRKKARLSTTHQHSLPTTLDCDKDAALEKAQEERHKNCLSTPRLLEKIIRYRNRRNNTEEFTQKSGAADDAVRNAPLQLTKVLIHPPMHSEFMSATSSDGQRVYMRMRKQENLKKVQTVNELITTTSRGLLPQTMTELRQIMFDERQYDVIEESRRITDEIRREALQLSAALNESMDETPLKENKKDERKHKTKRLKDGLWVNKYTPTRYTHLLSDETVNRALLKWLKLWDGVVFGRDPPVRKKNESNNEKQNNRFQNKWKTKQDLGDVDNELDETKRPKFKAALLCGPPGLGKTTLAHVVAKHAGYHVVEMNASDDRSTEVFKKKLEETTQMKSVLGVSERPNCLIVDEIDGAPQAAINILLNAMNRVKKQDAKKKRSKGGGSSVLLRPIICICNDLYVPALRQLRQNSFILQFPPTTTAKLASRLRQMCNLQQLDCDMTILLALCEKSSNDIRTCINTLQFLHAKDDERLSLESIRKLPIGQKDQHQSVFYVWNEIFQQPKNQRKMEQNSMSIQQLSDGQKVNQFSVRFYHILNVIIASGEYEKVLQGVFENFLAMKFKDCGMQTVNKAYEWLVLYDCLNEEILSRQEWILMQYIPYLFVIFHLLFSCLSPPRIQFPQSVQENRQKLQKSEHLLATMYVEMSPEIRCFSSPTVALLETVPHLLSIMTPNIRAVNMQLYSPAEKKQLHDLVGSMLSYNLTFRQERNQDGQYNYVLEPDMAEACQFNEDNATARKVLSYAIKQIIAKEVEMERMRRIESRGTLVKKNENNKENENKKPSSPKSQKSSSQTDLLKSQKSSSQTDPPKSQKSSSQTDLPNHLQRLENNMNTIKVPTRNKPDINFFRQFTKMKRVDKDGKEQSSKRAVEIHDPGIGNSELWYKYNEGFSNAVRRKVYVKDFL